MEDLIRAFETFIKDLIENPILLTFVILVVIFIAREIRCWYWKIEERLELQKEEIATLTELVDLQKTQIRLLESNISKMNQLIFNTTAEEAAPTKEDELE